MKLILSALICFAVILCNGQRTIDVSKVDETPTRGLFYVVGGTPFSMAKYANVIEGTPYFKDEWMKGIAIIKSGDQYDNQLLKLDLISNELHYLDSTGQEMITTEKVVEVILKDTLSGKQYRFVFSSAIDVPKSERPLAGWYELLSMGAANLFCKHQKEIVETRPYGAATYEQSIKTVNDYFIAYDGSFYHIKKIKEIPDILIDKRTELINYINNKGLSGKSVSDYSGLIDYYNSLHRK
jgi:hypothetical protein